jgi:hypothetical protein
MMSTNAGMSTKFKDFLIIFSFVYFSYLRNLLNMTALFYLIIAIDIIISNRYRFYINMNKCQPGSVTNGNCMTTQQQRRTMFTLILAILISWFICSLNFLNYLAFQPFDFERTHVSDDGYSRNASCALHLISTIR